LPDSSMVGVRVGEVRRVLCAAQSYLAKHPPIVELSELTEHQIIATTQFGSDAWSFPAEDDSLTPRIVHFKPRVTVNSVRAAQASAVDGRGLVRLFSHQVTEQVRDGRLVVLRSDAPVPVYVVTPERRLAVPRVRAFVDFVTPRLRAQFSRLALDATVLVPDSLRPAG
jgi:DNA-binding transcriptional LysR family regulator